LIKKNKTTLINEKKKLFVFVKKLVKRKGIGGNDFESIQIQRIYYILFVMTMYPGVNYSEYVEILLQEHCSIIITNVCYFKYKGILSFISQLLIELYIYLCF
jgi:hypothetical protein